MSKYNKFLLIYRLFKKKEKIYKSLFRSLKNIKNKSFKYKQYKKIYQIINIYINQHLIYKPKISNSYTKFKIRKT